MCICIHLYVYMCVCVPLAFCTPKCLSLKAIHLYKQTHKFTNVIFALMNCKSIKIYSATIYKQYSLIHNSNYRN